MKKICCVLVALILITYCQAQKVNLGLNLSKGETYYLNIKTYASLDVPMNGKQINSQDHTNVRMKFKVTDIQDSIYNHYCPIKN